MPHASLLRNINGIRALLALNDPQHEPSINALWKKIEEEVAGIPETESNVITAENPWEFTPKAGTRFAGIYVVDKPIANNVYKGHQVIWHDKNGEVTREIVVKCTPFSKDMDAQERATRVEHEKRAVTVMGLEANNSHYSTELLAAGRFVTPQDETLFFWQVFEVMAGDLEQLHKRMHGAISPYFLLRYFREICEALANIHAKGIVHRDIKPENILYAEGPTAELRWFMSHIKLTDAHLAAGTANDVTVTQAGAVCGTPQFMSPEQAHGSHDIGCESDLWSLGVTMYYLCTGELPYSFTAGKGSHSSIPSIQFLQKMLAEEPKKFSAHEANRGYPRYFVNLIDRMLTKDPAQRPKALECVYANEQEYTPIAIDPRAFPDYLEKTIELPPPAEK